MEKYWKVRHKWLDSDEANDFDDDLADFFDEFEDFMGVPIGN